MKRSRQTIRRVIRWASLVTCLAMAAAFAISAKRALSWTSSDLRYEFGLMLGTVDYSWRPDTWRRDADPYAGVAGWSMAEFVGGQWLWWITPHANRAWTGVTIPLWIPFAIFAAPTAVLWYRDRRTVRQAWAQWSDRWTRRLTPSQRQHITPRLVLSMTAFHAVVVVGLAVVANPFCDFFFPMRFPTPRLIDTVLNVCMQWVLPILFLSAPVWGTLWAAGFVRLRNRLLRTGSGYRCRRCCYDLTGNVSGVCPECGEMIPPDAGRASGRSSAGPRLNA